MIVPATQMMSSWGHLVGEPGQSKSPLLGIHCTPSRASRCTFSITVRAGSEKRHHLKSPSWQMEPRPVCPTGSVFTDPKSVFVPILSHHKGEAPRAMPPVPSESLCHPRALPSMSWH